MWFFADLCLIILASILAIWAKVESRKEKDRLDESQLSADDFEIIEGD